MTAHTAIKEFGFPGAEKRPGGEMGYLAVPQRSYVTGIVLFLIPVLMFFLALTSALVVRKGLSDDWLSLELPRVLWFSTSVIVLSSLTIELARRRLCRGSVGGFRFWWMVTTALGFAFLAGQWMAWRDLVQQGIYVASNPSSSFFYVLTGSHGAHLLGGLVALLFVGIRGTRSGPRLTAATAVRTSSIYWHFMGGLWVYLYLLLWLGR